MAIISRILITIKTILQYLAQARQAQEKLNEAKEAMKRAAEELCSNWEGEAAKAFAQEQGVLYNYCTELTGVGDEYIEGIQKVAENYRNAEETVINAIKG